MKKYFLFLLFPILISCDATTNFDWLLGDWERTNEQGAVKTFEHWEKKSATEYIGSGVTMQLQDTVWMENIRLVKVNGTWNFEATGMGESHATIFQLTEMSTTTFTCRNEANEFPKQIHYFKDQEMLKAVISGGAPDVEFHFKRI